MRLIEFGDMDRLPHLYHFYLRKYLGFLFFIFLLKLWLPFFEKFVITAKSNVIVECCAGSGELYLPNRTRPLFQAPYLKLHLLMPSAPQPSCVHSFPPHYHKFRSRY